MALSFVASSTAIDKDTAVFRQETLSVPELLAVRHSSRGILTDFPGFSTLLLFGNFKKYELDNHLQTVVKR